MQTTLQILLAIMPILSIRVCFELLIDNKRMSSPCSGQYFDFRIIY